MRILKLLEEYHTQLAKALSSTNSKPITPSKADSQDQEKPEIEPQKHEEYKSKVEEKPRKTSGSSLGALSIRRPLRRDLTSSIASNLATARGRPPSNKRALPITPEVTDKNVDGKIVAQPTLVPSIPPSRVKSSSASTPSKTTPATGTADGFQTFFNSFESLFSKLSAPLAFAGLPLTNEPIIEEPVEPETRSGKRGHSRQASTRATADPDLSTIFSAPALRAIKEDVGPAFAHESFYVVPTSGGTRSYAGIVRGSSDLSNFEDGEGSDGEFVDARETLGSQSPRSTRGSTILGRARKVKPQKDATSSSGKTMEELELENSALRQLLDTQSRRLQMWEASAQSQSMALAKSMRLTAAPRQSPQPESERMRELQDQLAAERVQRETIERQSEKLARDNDKLIGILSKYRNKWELLKESARQREKRKDEEKKASAS